MKTKCMSCGGPTKKMQKGGSTDSTRTAPYVSPKGAFYPDKKSLESGCAKNPNSPECKKVIKTMSPAEAAKIKGRLQKGGAIKKMQNGGSTGKTKKYKTKNSYSELTGTSGNPLRTNVSSPDGSYKKSIEWQSYLADGNKPYEMSVTKGGKTNQFQLSKEQALSQRKKVKKTMGFQKKGGIVKPVVKKPVVKK
jgi:hypothetical protein